MGAELMLVGVQRKIGLANPAQIQGMSRRWAETLRQTNDPVRSEQAPRRARWINGWTWHPAFKIPPAGPSPCAGRPVRFQAPHACPYPSTPCSRSGSTRPRCRRSDRQYSARHRHDRQYIRPAMSRLCRPSRTAARAARTHRNERRFPALFDRHGSAHGVRTGRAAGDYRETPPMASHPTASAANVWLYKYR